MGGMIPRPDCCSLGAGPLTTAEAERFAAIFRVVADPVRLRILSQIAAEGCRPLSVSELSEYVGVSQPTVSHHLKKMAEAGLVVRSQVGRTVTHCVCADIFGELQQVLQVRRQC